MAPTVHSLPPILPPKPILLILGSMPGVLSLAQARYYAHPRNSFWSIMMRLLNGDVNSPYETRVATLKQSGIGLWDVLQSCERVGSLDARIDTASERANNIATLLSEQPSICAVATNGNKAFESYQRHVIPALDDRLIKRVQVLRLPSTSPANARMRIEDKYQHWKSALNRWLAIC